MKTPKVTLIMALLNPESLMGIQIFKDIMGFRPPRIKNYRQRLVAGRKRGQDTLESLKLALEEYGITIEATKAQLGHSTNKDYNTILSGLQELIVSRNNIRLLIWCYTYNIWLGTCISSANLRVFVKSLVIDGTGTIRLGYQDLKNAKGSISLNLDQPLPFKVRS